MRTVPGVWTKEVLRARAVLDAAPVSASVFPRYPDSSVLPPPLNIITFSEVDGRTILSLLVQCTTKELREPIIKSGMEVGMQEQMDLLEQIAISLR